jgi:uncharacterized protein (TIGR01732 family)
MGETKSGYGNGSGFALIIVLFILLIIIAAAAFNSGDHDGGYGGYGC